jgi:hypothetical protein
MKINSYNFDIFYKNGKKHTNADAMFRLPSAAVNTIGFRRLGTATSVAAFRKLQRQDKTWAPIIGYLERDKEGEGQKMEAVK